MLGRVPAAKAASTLLSLLAFTEEPAMLSVSEQLEDLEGAVNLGSLVNKHT